MWIRPLSARLISEREAAMTGIIDTVLAGILLGGIYALFALGLSLIFGIMRLVNLAHGDLILLAAYLVLTVTTALGLPLPVATIVVIAAMFALGFILQRLVLERLLGDDILPPLLVTFGLSIIIQNGLLLVFGADSQRLQAGAFESSSIMLAPGLGIGLAPLTALILAILAVALLQLVFYRTSLGRAFRATADNPQIAQLMGIDHRNIYAAAVGISLAVSVVAAVAFGIRANFDPSIGPARLLYAFEAVIIGGLGSLWGTLAGGIVLGLAQTIGARIDPEWQILAGHLAFLAVLMVRPRGLFPSRRP
jgi:branched-chain amino acid transport system permease protein